MNREDCETLKEVYQKPPSPIAWAKIESLVEAIAKERGGSWEYVHGDWLTLTVPNGPKPEDQDTALFPYSPVAYRGMIEVMEEFFVLVGVSLCP